MAINNILQPDVSIVEKSNVTATTKEVYYRLVGDGTMGSTTPMMGAEDSTSLMLSRRMRIGL